jgi:hypothetical protein
MCDNLHRRPKRQEKADQRDKQLNRSQTGLFGGSAHDDA